MVYVERDSFAAALLVARMADKALGEAPVWDDLATFDGRPWRGRVHIVSAGFPCQPWSHAGARLGTEDERWVWPEIARVVGETRPCYVFLENVGGLVSGGGLGPVLGSLAALGYDAVWGCFSAAEVGAPQVRERVFILARDPAQPDPLGDAARSWEPSGEQQGRARCAGEAGRGLGDADGEHGAGRRAGPAPGGRGAGLAPGHGEVADADGAGPSLASVQRGEGGEAAPPFDWRGAGVGRPRLPHLGALADSEGAGLLRAAEPGDHGAGDPRETRRDASDPSGELAVEACPDDPERWHVGGGWDLCTTAAGLDTIRAELASAEGAGLEDAGRPRGGRPPRARPERGSLPVFPPGPADFDSWRAILATRPDLAPGLPSAAQPRVRGVADELAGGLERGLTPRPDRLRVLGNGVMPLAAALAFLDLRAALTGQAPVR